MNSVENFIKLFDLNIPKLEYFDYYLHQMSKTGKYGEILEFYKMYNKIDNKILCTWEYRQDKANEISEFIESTNAYNEMCYDKSLGDYLTSKNIEYDDKIKYFSVDLRLATWSALKYYDPQHINELGDSLDCFLQKFDLPEVFVKSKYLRQFLFSKIDTKKIHKVQRNLIQEIVKQYQNIFQIEGVRNDEVIFSFSHFEEIEDIIEKIDKKKYKTKIFTIEKVEDFRIDSYYDIDGNVYHKELVGVDSSFFYLNLKKYITCEKIELKDLYFKFNERLAILDEEKLEIKLND